MTIKRGSRGESVERVQRALMAAGIEVAIDGDFGRNTETGVREFQRRNALTVDGVVGPDTLAALDAGTNLRDSRSKEVPPYVEAKIEEYVDLTARKNDTLLEKSQDALANFQTTMSFASLKEARPDLVGSMMSKVFDFAASKVIEALGPVTEVIKSIYDAGTEELARAGKAAASSSIGDWIKDQRGAIDRIRDKFDPDEIRLEMRSKYTEATDPMLVLAMLVDRVPRLRTFELPPIEELELQLYEQWINAHFRAIREDAIGFVAVSVPEVSSMKVSSCTVRAPEGAKVAHALNRLFTKLGDLKPLDLKVHKRACFHVPNFMPGGETWDCGWLDPDNTLVFDPVMDTAKAAVRKMEWRSVSRFSE